MSSASALDSTVEGNNQSDLIKNEAVPVLQRSG